jgi:16S rRNA (adenine1518-N6/adenine1519-N6)-dimethyltransferase
MKNNHVSSPISAAAMWSFSLSVILISATFGVDGFVHPIIVSDTSWADAGVLDRIHGIAIPVPRSFSCGSPSRSSLFGWVQQVEGEWEWEEDAGGAVITKALGSPASAGIEVAQATAAPKLPQGSFRPKQSLGQNFLQDGNTVRRIVTAFASDIDQTRIEGESIRAVELGPGAGAITGNLVETFGLDDLQCIEIDPRAVELLGKSQPGLRVTHMDVLQVDYDQMAKGEGGPLFVVGNLPYYITSQILFALADASHNGAVRSATVTMQWEVAQRIVAPNHCKDYGILSVVFQLYCESCNLHFKIPPTVFYPRPKVDSALIGLHFCSPSELRRRFGGITPMQLRRVLASIFQQRRKTIRNSLRKLVTQEICQGDKEAAARILNSAPAGAPDPDTALSNNDDDEEGPLPANWADLRPEQITPRQFVQITQHVFNNEQSVAGPSSSSPPITSELGHKVWRKMKHGS